MSASEDDDAAVIDTVCPHGHERHTPPEIQFVSDDGLFKDGKGAIYEPAAIERGDQAFIQADIGAFVEDYQ